LRASFFPRAFAFDPGNGSCGGALAEVFGEKDVSLDRRTSNEPGTTDSVEPNVPPPRPPVQLMLGGGSVGDVPITFLLTVFLELRSLNTASYREIPR
jgi:hypothetical protein